MTTVRLVPLQHFLGNVSDLLGGVALAVFAAVQARGFNSVVCPRWAAALKDGRRADFFSGCDGFRFLPFCGVQPLRLAHALD